MAKHSFYRKKRGFSFRRFLLIGIVLAAVGGAVWKMLPKNPSSETSSSEATLSQSAPSNQSKLPVPIIAQPIKTEPAEPEITPIPTAIPDVPKIDPLIQKTQDLIEQAEQALSQDKPIEARTLLNQAFTAELPLDLKGQIRDLINDAAKKWLFTLNRYPDDPLSSQYQVAPGDNLRAIGKQFNIPYQFIMRINNIKDETKLRANQNIKVVKGPFNAVVDKSECVIDVYLEKYIVCSFFISVGLPGRDTPTGTWLVKAGSKLINPEWTDPDTGVKFYPDNPLNPLGERWIGLKGVKGNALGRTGFGIHGTIEPEKIGKPASRGCIRMRNKEVEILYDMLYGNKSQVVIVD